MGVAVVVWVVVNMGVAVDVWVAVDVSVWEMRYVGQSCIVFV